MILQLNDLFVIYTSTGDFFYVQTFFIVLLYFPSPGKKNALNFTSSLFLLRTCSFPACLRVSFSTELHTFKDRNENGKKEILVVNRRGHHLYIYDIVVIK